MGPGKRFTTAQRNGFGRSQGPIDLCIEQPLNVLQESLLLLQLRV